MAATPPTNPAEAFGAGDPRNAAYFQTLANLEHQYNTTLAGDKERLQNSRTNATYQQGLIGQREPGSYKANSHRANAGGILESGVNAERRGTIGQEYANKRYGVTHGLQETEGSISRNEQGAKERLELGKSGAANTALMEGYKSLLEREPNEQVQAPPQAIPNTAASPGVSVARITAQPNTGGVRRAAGNKYLAKAKARRF